MRKNKPDRQIPKSNGSHMWFKALVMTADSIWSMLPTLTLLLSDV